MGSGGQAGWAQRAGTRQLVIGVTLLVGACWGLARGVEWIAQPFYAWAWWGYILSVDGLAARRRGNSLLTTRRRYLFPLAIASITFWFFFELLNLRFQNWYYVGVYPSRNAAEIATAALFVLAAFSTVFIGIFATYEALTAYGIWRKRSGRRRPLAPWVSYAIQAVGLAMATAALSSPTYLAPLIWGSFTFLIDPWNYRHGHRSLLHDIEARDWGLVGRLFAAGLICGLVWESLNFWSPQKWIYTVRGLEHAKLFEMPLIGFLGFPGLAFDSLAGFSLFSRCFCGGRSWEDPADLAYELPPPRPAVAGKPLVGLLLLASIFWVVVGLQVIRTNIGSVQLELEAFVDAGDLSQWNAAGVRRPKQLLRALDIPQERASLAAVLGWPAEQLDTLERRVKLATFKGIGAPLAAQLEAIGIVNVSDLGAESAERLHARLLRRFPDHTPRIDIVRVWVLASRDRGVWLNAP